MPLVCDGDGDGGDGGGSAVQTEVNEVPPAPCYPSWTGSGYNSRLTRAATGCADNSEQLLALPIIHAKRFNSLLTWTTLATADVPSADTDSIKLIYFVFDAYLIFVTGATGGARVNFFWAV